MHPGSSEECRRIAREVNILRDGHHPDIVKLKQVLDVPSYPYICIVMPLYPGTLHDVIVDHAHRETWLTETRIWEIFLQIVSGLHYIHEKEVVHRDLKPSNCKKDGSVALADFGLAQYYSGSQQYTENVGAAVYTAPEVVTANYTKKVDMFSLGVIVYEMCMLDHAFEGNDVKSRGADATRGHLVPGLYTIDLVSIVLVLLSADPDDRPTTSSVLLRTKLTRKLLSE
ncbi:hypothetical protein BG003_010347 [Podila horticola]|nr:hypothetical protein BG003_010347 [Podila horticola]